MDSESWKSKYELRWRDLASAASSTEAFEIARLAFFLGRTADWGTIGRGGKLGMKKGQSLVMDYVG